MNKSNSLGGSKKKKNFFKNIVAPGDLTWIKIKGHPWWPSLVIKRTKENKRLNGSPYLADVQFLGIHPSRGCVKERFVKPFNGSNSEECQLGGTYFSSDRDWKVAVKEANEALKLSPAERLKLVVPVESSDDEDMEVYDERKDDMSSKGGKKAKKGIQMKKMSEKSKSLKEGLPRKENKDVDILTSKQIEVSVKPELLADSEASAKGSQPPRCSTLCSAVLEAQTVMFESPEKIEAFLRPLSIMLRSDADIAPECLSYYAYMVDQMKIKKVPLMGKKFKPILDDFLKDVRGSGESVEQLSAMLKFRMPKVLDFFTRNETLAKIIMDYEWSVLPENKSMLGELLNMGANTIFFSNNQNNLHIISEIETSIENNLHKITDRLVHLMHNFFQKLLDFGGDVELLFLCWIGEVLHKYEDQSNIHRVIRGNFTDNLLVNLSNVLFTIFKPSLDDHSKLLEIHPSYCWAINERAEAAGRRIHMREILRKKFLIPSPEAPSSKVHSKSASSSSSSEPLKWRYAMTNDIFFMCHLCFDLGFSVTDTKFTRLICEMEVKKKRYKELLDQEQGDTEEALSLKARLDSDFPLFLCYKVILTQHQLLEKAFLFMAFTANFLVHVSMTPPGSSPPRVNKAKFQSPSRTPGRSLKYIPEFILDNFQSLMVFLKLHKDDIFEGKIQRNHLESLLDFLLLFISNQHFINNPYQRNEMADTLECLFPTLQPNTSREKLLVKSANANRVMKSVMELFVQMKPTRYQLDRERFLFIPSIVSMFDYLCGIRCHRNVLKDLILYAERHIDTEDPPLFLRFMFYLLDDAKYYLEEALELMVQIRGAMDVDKQASSFISKVEKAQNYNDISVLLISTISHITSLGSRVISHPFMVKQFADLITYYLDKLIGPEWAAINNPEDFNFSRQWLVIEISRIFCDFALNQSFLRAFASIESMELIEMTNLALAEYNQPDILDMKKITRFINAFIEEKAEEEERMTNAPARFKDVITNLIMTDPIEIPADYEEFVVDRMALIHFLLDGVNPRTKLPLKMEMVTPLTDLKIEIKQWPGQPLRKKCYNLFEVLDSVQID